MKRMLMTFSCLMLTLSLLCGSARCPGALAETGIAGGEVPAETVDAVDEILAGMSLRDKLAQMMFISPRTWKDDPGSEKAENVRLLNGTLRQFIGEHRFGGILFFAENFADAGQTLRLASEIQAANLAGGGLPMFMAADQEGGTVARLGFGTAGTGSMALAATGDPDNARRMARVFGEELGLLGVNVDFAPVVDVNDNPANPVIGVRAFGDDAETVSAYACAYVQGLHDTGTLATVKHFPGHGNTDTDSHTGLPLVNRSHEELLLNELIPFKAAIDAGADMVMTAHIQFPLVETQTYTSVSTGEEVYIPATMSKTILTGILRGELGFEGVIVSDALEMGAIWDNYAMDDVLAMAVNAGVNMLILPCIYDADSLGQIDGMLSRAEALTESGIIDIARVDDSVRRILALKQKYGLLERTDFTVTEEKIEAAVNGCGSAEHRRIAWEFAARALTLLKNENGAFPIRPEAGEETLILFTSASRAGAGPLAGELLRRMNALPENARITGMVIEPDTADACLGAARAADHVILVSRAWAPGCLDPSTADGYPVGIANQIIEELHRAGKTAIAISAQLPYDATCYPEADAILLAYCSSAMKEIPPASGEGSAYVPNLPAAICACFGAVEPAGTLPVDLPALDGDHHLTDEILYPSGAGGRGEAKRAEGSSPVRAAAVPGYEWQKSAVFPDWKGYTDDTLAMNSMLGFQSFHGQGSLWMKVSEEVERFTLYVNGQKIDTSPMTGGAWMLDISALAVDGMNTLQVSNITPQGPESTVAVHIPYPGVLAAQDGLEGIQPQALRLISDIIESDVRHGFTSAQLAVVKNGRLVCENAWGRVNSYRPDGTPDAGSPAATRETLYDLASVTKMFSVNYAVQKLVTDELLELDAPIVDILGDGFAEDTLDIRYADVEDPVDIGTQKAWKRALTVRDILRHQAGFPAGPHYNNPDYDMSLQAVGAPGSNLCHASNRVQTLGAICKTPLLYAPGTRTVYSDVDYMLLTFVVEAITGQRLDDYMREAFFVPLGLRRVTFLPLENGFAAEDCAATELNGNTRDSHVAFEGIRTETLQGEVHDERAWYCMEGVSGHAGLFANAADLAKLASVMLTGGYGGHRFFSRNAIDLFTAPKALGFGQWGLGWWREGDDQRVWYFGTEAAPNTVGHQGWTGTLVMIDPSRNLVIAYLTNKINSPITDESNLNGFDGGCYTASTLGFVPQILSIGMDSAADISGQLLDLLADMAVESVKLIPEGADGDHPRTRNARSKAQVLKAWAEAAGDGGYADLADAILRQYEESGARDPSA